MKRTIVAAVLQVVGLAVTAAGFAMVWPPAGVIAAGAGVLAFGVAAERAG